MDNKKELPESKSIRLKNYDYSSAGAYFVTICTENRRHILSRIVVEDIPSIPKNVEFLPDGIVGGDVLDAPKNIELLPYGKIADKYINQLNNFYSYISVDKYVIMPNHIHIMLFVPNGGASRTSPPTTQHSYISQFVSTLKRFCNKEYGKNIWQRNFNDHVIRNYGDYEEHLRYIYENPVNWYCDELYINNK